MFIQINKLRKKAQSTAEYVTLIALAIGAVALAKTYVTKALAGKIQAASNGYLQGTNVGTPGDLSANGVALFQANANDMTSRLGVSAENAGQASQLDINHGFNAVTASDNQRAIISGDLGEIQSAASGTILTNNYNTQSATASAESTTPGAAVSLPAMPSSNQ